MEDFTPVIQPVRYANVLVASVASGLESVQDLIARAKASPGSLPSAAQAPRRPLHLAVELLKQRAGIQLPHVSWAWRPPEERPDGWAYPARRPDGLGGQMEVIKSGARCARLAVWPAPKRAQLAPEIPSLGDVGIHDVDGSGPVRGARARSHARPDRCAAAQGIRRCDPAQADARAVYRYWCRAGRPSEEFRRSATSGAMTEVIKAVALRKLR